MVKNFFQINQVQVIDEIHIHFSMGILNGWGKIENFYDGIKK
jgi:hypothetical protein